MENLKSYRYCIVPGCTSTSIKTRDKHFFCLPTSKAVRMKWLRAMRRNPHDFKMTTTCFVCEDHFNLEEDLENFVKFKYQEGRKRNPMKKNVVPHLFSCQPDRCQTNNQGRPSANSLIKKKYIAQLMREMESKEHGSSPLSMETFKVKTEKDDWDQYTCVKTEVLLGDDYSEVNREGDQFMPAAICNEEIIIKTETPNSLPGNIKLVLMCDVCMQIFPEAELLAVHMKETHLNEKPFSCGSCDEQHATRQQLLEHVVNGCDSRWIKARRGLKERKFLCDKCNRLYTTEKILKCHKKICGAPNVQCYYCNKLYTCVNYLRQHIHQNHMRGKLKFPCPMCGKTYSFKYKMKQHMKYACGGNKLPCGKCPKLFGSRQSLNYHLENAHFQD